MSQRPVYTLLGHPGYSLQSNRKTGEGGTHPDRDAQFRHIAALVSRLQAAGQPVISVDAKKKELIGAFYKKGREWQPQGQPEQVNVYDFVDTDLGKAIPQTTTAQGLVIQTDLDDQRYATGTKVADEPFDMIALERDEFHGDWNYRIKPRLAP